MTPARYTELEYGDIPLTEEEIQDGWHFCKDWDYMLIHDSWSEIEGCHCDSIRTPKINPLG